MKPTLAKMSKKYPKKVMPTKAATSIARLVATKIESMSFGGSPRKNANVVSAVSNAAIKYLSHAGGTRIALPAIRASVASASASTPGITLSTGVGLASLSPEAV